ncbi:MAG: AMP-binding protein, partial [Myxococcota bacterium]
MGDERGAGCVAAPADVQIGRLRPAGRPCIGDQFETVANRWRDRPALDTGTECLSYGELRAAADLVARRIQRAGTAPSARVALMFQRPAALVPSLLGVLKAGCAYVPLDPTFPAARVAYVLKDSDASLVLCDSDTQDLARDLTGGGRPLIDVDELGPTSEPVPDRRIAPDDLASILYTSGSMGEPKGVVQTHRNLVQYARNYIGALDIRPTDRVSLLFSYSFSASVPDLFGTLLSGAALCPFDVKRNGAAALARWIRSAEISVLHLVPTVFRHLLPRLAEERELPSLRAVDLGGEALYPADVAAFHAHPGIRSVLVHRLAATEASLITQHRLSRDVPQGTRAVPVGHPVEGMEIRIEGPDGDVVAPGEPGEIVLRSRYLSPGYWRKPDLTERSFRNDPNEPG